jgi:hypothetical protein
VKKGDFKGQLRHLVGELQGSERGALAALKSARTPEQAAEIFTRHFERPSEGEIQSSLAARQAAARRIFESGGGGGSAVTSDAAKRRANFKGTTTGTPDTVTPGAIVPDPTRAAGMAALESLGSKATGGLPKLGLRSTGTADRAAQLLASGAATKQLPPTVTAGEAPKNVFGEVTDTTTSVHGGKNGQFHITGPNPGRLKPAIVRFARQVAAEAGEPLSGSDGTGHSRLTVDGNVSQHSTGDATDIPATGERLIRLGQAALVAAGMPRAQARKQRGGLYNVNGKQIIFNTQEGGDHTTHLHLGD